MLSLLRRFAIALVLGVLWLIGAAAMPAEAQRSIERGMVINPLLEERDPAPEGQTRWIHGFGGWIGFGPYLQTRYTGPAAPRESHAWLHQLGGFLEIARFGPSASLLVTSQIEMVADPHNEINFNPRSIFWEEGLLFTRRFDGFDLQLGYYHRCKHDIDNLLRGEERTLIFGSALGQVLVPFEGGGWQRGLMAVKADLYTITEDFRRPVEARGRMPDWSRLLGSLEALLHIERPLAGMVHGYAHGYGLLTLYSSEAGGFFERLGRPGPVRPGGGLSAGLALRGHAGALRLGLDYEYLHDTGVSAFPQGAHLLRLGLTVLDPFSVR